MSQQLKKTIDQASDQELRDFAELVLQLEVPATAQRFDVLALITPAWPADYIYVDAAEIEEFEQAQDESVRAEARIKLAVSAAYQDDPKWLVKITSTELIGGRDPVSVGVNGRPVVIQRGMEVEVPHRFIEALRLAVRESVTQDPRTGDFHRTNFTNYPLEILERPSRAEIDAWFERTKDLVLA